jgi:heat shock protein HtpX
MNVFKTYALLLALTALLTAFGWVLDRFLGTGSTMMMIFFAFGIVSNWVSYFYSDKIVLRMYNAQEVSSSDAPQLHEIVARVASNAGIPKPRVCVIPTDVPNAFATGRNPSHAVVAVTEGIMRALSWDELEGVIAHEMGHVRNRDTLVSTVAATLAGVIGMAAHSAQWGMMFGGGRRDSEGNSNPLGMVLMLIMIVIAPMIAVMVQMAISRTREFGADRSGAEITGNPAALASALQKIDAFAHRSPVEANPGTAHLFIINPLSGEKAMSLFSTHPPTAERVRRLQEMEKEFMTGRSHHNDPRMGTMR